jgi:hypothetical protein
MRALEQCEALENGYATVADGVPQAPADAVGQGHQRRPEFTRRSTNTSAVTASTTSSSSAAAHRRPPALGRHHGRREDRRHHDVPRRPQLHRHRQPQDDIGALTVADTTFIWNRNEDGGMAAATIAAQIPTLYVYIKQGAPDVRATYTISLGWHHRHVRRDATRRAHQHHHEHRRDLASLIDAHRGGFTATRRTTLVIGTDHSDFDFTCTTQAGGSLMIGFKNRVERYSDLPRTFVEGADGRSARAG